MGPGEREPASRLGSAGAEAEMKLRCQVFVKEADDRGEIQLLQAHCSLSQPCGELKSKGWP